jgi:hypothetical protein
MTEPVVTEDASRKIAMTAPVMMQRSDEGKDGSYRISFMMPMNYTLDTLPTLNNPACP